MPKASRVVQILSLLLAAGAVVVLAGCGGGGGGGGTGSAAPAAPSDLAATAVTLTGIDLGWTDNSGNEDGFRIERGTDGTNFSVIATTAANAASYSDTNLPPATTYYYRVRATNSAGDSEASNILSTATRNPTFSNFQAASTVIGQPTFTASASNQGGIAGANTLGSVYGDPLVHNGILYLPDYGNERVLGFNTVPTANDASADFVLGQPDLVTTASGSAANEMDGPQSVKFFDGKLFIDDYGNNRVLIWNSAPTATQAPADIVVGQPDFGSYVSSCTATGLNSPESITVAGGKLFVADSNNNRVLIWNSIPASSGAPADVVLGQNGFTTCAENDDIQSGASTTYATSRTLFYPSGIWSDGTRLIVADADNNRVLIWNAVPAVNFTPADVVLGQGDFTHSAWNDDNQDDASDAAPTARTLSFPYFLDSNGKQLFVADEDNNRVLIWNSIPTANFTPADVVLGQGDFTHSAYNDDDQDDARDSGPTARTLYSPRGVYIYGARLFIADGGNYRFLIYDSQ